MVRATFNELKLTQTAMMSERQNTGALEGVRVIDLTRMLSGPFCTMLLGDQGAEVIKIEPFEGDTTRSHGPYREDDPKRLFGGYFQSVNRNKKSIVLDLKTNDAREVVLRLVKTAHVLVENFRPGVMERLGLGYETLNAINPRLVYAAIRGFGDPRSGKSPYQDWPAYDVVAQAMGGVIGVTGFPDQPVKVGPGLGDILPGTMTAFGIAVALRHAERTGQGQFLDVSMYDSVLSLCERAIYQHSFADLVPGPEGQAHPFFVPFGLFPASDGWIAIACPNDMFFGNLAQAMEKPDLARDARGETKAARAKNRAFINDAVTAWTRRHTKAELKEKLGGRVPFGPVNTASDIFGDEHLRAREMLAEVEHPGSNAPSVIAGTPVKLQGTPGGVRRRAPYLGEHTGDLLTELGYNAHDLQRLRDARAVL
jgi:crotonobetainyl-CoA:carnitine CoA-transferase CaiB-like acyl-CoA transferase